MGRKFWLRVAGGALVVFLLGFALFTGARAAKQEAGHAIAEVASSLGGEVPAMLAGLKDSVTVSLNGERLGRLQHLTVERPVEGKLPEVRALLRLDDLGRLRELASCSLTPANGRDLHQFRCAAAGETGLDQLGTVDIQGEDLELPLLVSDSLAAELRKGGPIHASLDLTENVRALVKVGDHKVVDIKADSNGARIVVNDEKGNKVVRMQADSTGFSLTVDSARPR